MGNSCDSMDFLVQGVADFIDAGELLAPMCSVVVGVSGGADSVALLSILRELSERPDRAYRLTVAHLNHGIRPEAGADEAWVVELAEKWKLPYVVEKCDVPALASRCGVGLEEAARRARYEFLARAAKRSVARYVAVGHHADDQVETVLYRIVRGTHIRGLAGMRPARALNDGENVTLVRPLLCCRRSELENYCRSRSLQWREDSSNTDTRYRRNFIRCELLPLLRDRLNDRADEAIGRLAEAAAQVEDLIEKLSEAAIRSSLRDEQSDSVVLDADLLGGEEAIVQAAVVREVLERLGAPMGKVDSRHLGDACEVLSSGGAVSLPGGFDVCRQRGELVISRTVAEPAEATQQCVKIECPGRTVLGDGREIICEIVDFDPAAFESHCSGHDAGVELLDADAICGELECRPRRSGESFSPLGLNGTQSVSDFLTNVKFPRRRLGEVLCICDDEGIVYLVPLRIADRVKVTGLTKRVLRIELVGRAP